MTGCPNVSVSKILNTFTKCNSLAKFNPNAAFFVGSSHAMMLHTFGAHVGVYYSRLETVIEIAIDRAAGHQYCAH